MSETPAAPERKDDRIQRDAIVLRPATDDDYDFQRLLYHSTREEEMKHFPFNEEQKVAFLDQQFAAQTSHYKTHYPACEWNIIEVGGERAGRILLDEWSEELRVVDIALMPRWRGSGIGGMLMREATERAAAAGKAATIHVEIYNPARRLYERLGFQYAESSGVYLLMRWTGQ
ncbi:MAG: GNAT family N-acetyltransferase [Acidobacteriota bacterium]|nr:GNAT family N-acetyltransferase [Acidobacteriota bacterium]